MGKLGKLTKTMMAPPHMDPRKLIFDKEMLKKLKRAVRLIKLIKLTKTVRGGEGLFLYRKQR